MKKNELVDIIKEIVVEEIHKELPNAIAKVFHTILEQKTTPLMENNSHEPHFNQPKNEKEVKMRQSLKEIFEGSNVVINKPQIKNTPKKFAKDPVINDILNSTRPFTSQERTGAPLGASAMLSNFQSNPISINSPLVTNDSTNTPSFMKNVPDMGQLFSGNSNINIELPKVSQTELLNDNHVPLSNLPEGISVMDVKESTPEPVAKALTRNYSEMMKLVDKKKGKL